MKLLTKAIEEKLRKNSENQVGDKVAPVLKLFTPWGRATWLFTELDEDNNLFGLCDIGLGTPELGYVSLDELKNIQGPLGLKIERDMNFKAKLPLKDFTEVAKMKCSIVDEDETVNKILNR